MKTIVQYVRDYLREEWNPVLFGVTGLFLTVAIVLNYVLGAETTIVRSLGHPGWQFIFYLAFYALPFMVTLLAWSATQQDYSVFKRRQFWFISLFTFSILSAYVVLHILPWYLYTHHVWIYDSVREDHRIIALRCAGNLLPLLLATPFILFYWHRADRTRLRPYGLDARTINMKPYFLILLLIAPVVIAVSFTNDFQQSYPRYKFGFPANILGAEKNLLLLIYELCYGADFIFVEFFFRGFMVLGLARVLDRTTKVQTSAAILPMVAVYAFIHFEKPLLEAISSIFGGLVLGVIAHRTKSIYGGIILHLGVAYLMELAGSLRMVFR
ncbi:MAG TPA: CPBP family intramembrane glutamic endopeptidase [Bacteroidota bacterium]|nr:CPBP family intramembrane glutamic endopeptidase [Bacteroidota bacterium]